MRNSLLLVLLAVAATVRSEVPEKEESQPPRCSLTVSPRPGESHISGNRSRLLQTGVNNIPQSSTKTITRNMKWLAEVRFRDDRPEKVELKAYYIGSDAKGGLVQLGTETKPLELDKNGRASVELTSPTTRLTKSRTSSGSSRFRGNGGFTSTKSTMRGERIAGCVVQVFADGVLAKNWTSDSRWAKEAGKPDFSITKLNQSKSKIGLR